MAGKRRIFERYRKNLVDMRAVRLVVPPPHVQSNYWFNNILVADPAALGSYLKDQGIGTRRFFYPLHLQPCYASLVAASCPNSLWLYEHGLSLPSSPQLPDEDIDLVCDHVRRFFGE
jgi:perosamine synthetase